MLKVVILCGGRGHRLKPLTRSIPKPLVTLNGRPVLEHIIKFYIGRGFRDFVLCTGYRADAIRKFVSESAFSANIEFSDAGLRAGILKRLHAARHLIDGRAVVTYGDTFIDIDIHKMLKEHSKTEAGATITLADIRSPFGLVTLDKTRKVRSFEEKPVFQYYIGHMILEKRVLDELSSNLISGQDGEGLINLFKKLIRTKKLYAYKHGGLKITFNTLYERQRAEEQFTKFFTEQEG